MALKDLVRFDMMGLDRGYWVLHRRICVEAKYYPEDDHYLLEKENMYKYTKYSTNHKITCYYQNN